jgi:hypothetical protein
MQPAQAAHINTLPMPGTHNQDLPRSMARNTLQRIQAAPGGCRREGWFRKECVRKATYNATLSRANTAVLHKGPSTWPHPTQVCCLGYSSTFPRSRQQLPAAREQRLQVGLEPKQQSTKASRLGHTQPWQHTRATDQNKPSHVAASNTGTATASWFRAKAVVYPGLSTGRHPTQVCCLGNIPTYLLATRAHRLQLGADFGADFGAEAVIL